MLKRLGLSCFALMVACSTSLSAPQDEFKSPMHKVLWTLVAEGVLRENPELFQTLAAKFLRLKAGEPVANPSINARMVPGFELSSNCFGTP